MKGPYADATTTSRQYTKYILRYFAEEKEFPAHKYTMYNAMQHIYVYIQQTHIRILMCKRHNRVVAVLVRGMCHFAYRNLYIYHTLREIYYSKKRKMSVLRWNITTISNHIGMYKQPKVVDIYTLYTTHIHTHIHVTTI